MAPRRRPQRAGERWLPIPGWEGCYDISDLGRVWSVPRSCNRNRSTAGGHLLRPGAQGGGYLFVLLYRDGQRHMRMVAKLVLEAFAGPCPEGQEALHGPGGKADNRLVNLRWGTRSQNAADKFRDGTNHVSPRITCAQARQIRARRAAQHELATEFGVTQSAISLIVNGKRHVDCL